MWRGGGGGGGGGVHGRSSGLLTVCYAPEIGELVSKRTTLAVSETTFEDRQTLLTAWLIFSFM